MTHITPIPFRPLGIIKTFLESLGHQVTHCYEDLIFVEHNAFLLRMEEKGEDVGLFFNCESEADQRPGIAATLISAGSHYRLNIRQQGTYRLTANETNSSLSLEFLENDI